MAAQAITPSLTVSEISDAYQVAVEFSYTLKFGSPEEKAYRVNVVGPLWREMNSAIGPIVPDVPQTLAAYEEMEFPTEYRDRREARGQQMWLPGSKGGR